MRFVFKATKGEGSRGGHVIGHSRGGKAKYGIPRTPSTRECYCHDPNCPKYHPRQAAAFQEPGRLEEETRRMVSAAADTRRDYTVRLYFGDAAPKAAERMLHEQRVQAHAEGDFVTFHVRAPKMRDAMREARMILGFTWRRPFDEARGDSVTLDNAPHTPGRGGSKVKGNG